VGVGGEIIGGVFASSGAGFAVAHAPKNIARRDVSIRFALLFFIWFFLPYSISAVCLDMNGENLELRAALLVSCAKSENLILNFQGSDSPFLRGVLMSCSVFQMNWKNYPLLAG
jgi:hypothetical protein